MRPKTIVYFEQIFLGTLLLSVLDGYLRWPARAAWANPRHPNLVIASWIFILMLVATLVLLVSRRRNKIAMWVLIAWFALSLPSFVQTIKVVLGSNIIVIREVRDVLLDPSSIAILGQGLALVLLFTPSARRRMNREDEKAA